MGDPLPVRSYAEANRLLAEAFDRYQIARGQSANTLRAYHESVAEFIVSLESESVLDANRAAIRRYQSGLLARGIHENSIRLRTCALRAFFKFLAATGLTRGHNPTLLLSYRKLPSRIPRVLTVSEVEKLISAGPTPIEAAIVEMLYSTGVRVSELVKLRLADVDFTARVSPYSARVRNGKGGKDRVVLFGEKAMCALRRYLLLTTKTHQTEFLFEVPPGVRLFRKKHSGRPRLPGPYGVKAIRYIIGNLAARAGIGHVHPHALRRAFATHMLERGADLRVIQELMGHVNLTTTMIYTSLSAANLKEIHDRCHPHAKEEEHGQEK